MKKKTKQPTYYFRMDADLIEKLSKRIARAGYSSRSDFFTAVAYVTLYGDKTENKTQTVAEGQTIATIPEHITAWISETLPRISEEQIQSGLQQIIADMLTPVIAMKGVDIAYENTWEDVRMAFHERYSVWVTESDLREAYASFAMVRRRELAEYRERQLRAGESAEE